MYGLTDPPRPRPYQHPFFPKGVNGTHARPGPHTDDRHPYPREPSQGGIGKTVVTDSHYLNPGPKGPRSPCGD